MATITFKAFLLEKNSDEALIKFYKNDDKKTHKFHAVIPKDSLNNFNDPAFTPSDVAKVSIEGFKNKDFKIFSISDDFVMSSKTVSFQHFFNTGGLDSTGTTSTKVQLQLK